jgi:hypothetical protein
MYWLRLMGDRAGRERCWVSYFSSSAAEQLGRRLHAERFRPLPDVTDEGVLIGTVLWRMSGDQVEYLALRRDGFALAMRAEARFNFRTPQLHGPVIDFRSGYAPNALSWLLASSPQ